VPEVANEIRFVPHRRSSLRLLVLVGLVLLAVICGASWYHLAVFAFFMGLLLGTFPRVRLRGELLEREFLLLFMPLHHVECRLGEIESLETGVEEQLGVAYGCLIGFQTWVIGKLVDRMAPWLGGDCKIWLRLRSGRRLLAWQGNNEQHFRQNLTVLERSTDLRAVRGSDFDVLTTAQIKQLLAETTIAKRLKALFSRRPPPGDR
jgi:hypothetical protein